MQHKMLKSLLCHMDFFLEKQLLFANSLCKDLISNKYCKINSLGE